MNMMKVIVDIAGMYYGRVVEVPVGATVRDAMIAARVADKLSRALDVKNNDGKNPVPQLNFAEDDRAPEFLRSITVDHKVKPESRQTKGIDDLPQDRRRFYPIGEYTFRNDAVALGSRADGSKGLVAVDQDGKPTGKSFIQTWQYYVYDAAGKDLSRAAGGPDSRSIVPFSERSASNTLMDGGQIVWRLVTIFLDASRRPAIITAAAEGYPLNAPAA